MPLVLGALDECLKPRAESASSMYCFGIMFMFETCTIDEKQRIALAGMNIASKGKCTKICRVVIIIHSFFRESPNTIDKKIFAVIAPVIA